MARRPSASQTEATNRAAIADPGAQGAERVVKPKSSGEKVTVACKLGVAYYDIYLCREETVSENTQTGPRDVTRYVPIRDNTVRLRGTAYPRGTVPDGFPDRPLIVGGAAMNPGIDKDWFDHWLDHGRLNSDGLNRRNRRLAGFHLGRLLLLRRRPLQPRRRPGPAVALQAACS